MRALFYRTFYPYDSRRVSLWYLSAGLRYTTPRRTEALPGVFDAPDDPISAVLEPRLAGHLAGPERAASSGDPQERRGRVSHRLPRPPRPSSAAGNAGAHWGFL